MIGGAFVPDTLFGGTTPNLSFLELWNCDINWKSPLLGGLKHLEIRTPLKRPSLSVWLEALDQMPQLKTLTLHWASPIAPLDVSIPSEAERAVTLPSLTLFEMFIPCEMLWNLVAGTIATCKKSYRMFLDMPMDPRIPNRYGVRWSVAVQGASKSLRGPCPTSTSSCPSRSPISDARHSGRVSFSVTNDDRSPGVDTDTFSAMMEALPLDGLVTLTAQNRNNPFNRQFWLRHAPKWPLLRRVRLTPPAERGFREMLMEDNEGRGGPLLPLLKTLVLVDIALLERRNLRLCDALTKRVEQGVPLETLDLCGCFATSHAIKLLSEIVVDCPGIRENLRDRDQTRFPSPELVSSTSKTSQTTILE
ncbi:hypothetical protein EDB89DRAFT_1276363 [Lactarius sanguifluus]|nr:hypothetical protein EDB89DRAFT_1276363 [Lactarius sanguifluus]